MRLTKLALVTTIALSAMACRDDRPPPPAIEPAGEPEPVLTADTRQVPLRDMAGADVSGELIVTPFPDSVIFHMVLSGAAPETTFGARLQTGTCESPGDVVAVLAAVFTGVLGNGRGQQTLAADAHGVLDGRHVAALYAPAAEPGRDRPLACAQIPALASPQ